MGGGVNGFDLDCLCFWAMDMSCLGWARLCVWGPLVFFCAFFEFGGTDFEFGGGAGLIFNYKMFDEHD